MGAINLPFTALPSRPVDGERKGLRLPALLLAAALLVQTFPQYQGTQTDATAYRADGIAVALCHCHPLRPGGPRAVGCSQREGGACTNGRPG